MRNIGKSALSVSNIGLGGMPLSIAGRPNEAEALRVIQEAANCGINFFDTADVYCLDQNDIGHNERLFAKALKGLDNVIIATKGGVERPNGAWTRNASSKHLQQACEQSLRALGVEQLQLYQLHAPDPNTIFEKSIEKLAELQYQQKIQYIGLSNVSIAEIERAKQLVDIVSVQNRCNLHDLTAFNSGVVEYCTNNNIAFLPYSPVGGKGGYHNLAAEPLLIQIGSQHNASPLQIALAWLLAKAPNIIPIPGASKISSIQSSAAAIHIKLTAADIESIDAEYM